MITGGQNKHEFVSVYVFFNFMPVRLFQTGLKFYQLCQIEAFEIICRCRPHSYASFHMIKRYEISPLPVPKSGDIHVSKTNSFTNHFKITPVGKLEPVSQPIRCKTVSNHDLVTLTHEFLMLTVPLRNFKIKCTLNVIVHNEKVFLYVLQTNLYLVYIWKKEDKGMNNFNKDKDCHE